MILIVLTNRKEIENAQREMIMSLGRHWDRQIPVKLGFQGGNIACSIYWSQVHGLWFCPGKIEENRYWNAFGLSEDTPRQDSMLSIVCEINPPVKGLNRAVQGAFVRDKNGHIFLLHRGKIGGGRPGIGRKLFFENYEEEVREINGIKFAVIGDITSPDFIKRVQLFVKEVKRIKGLAPARVKQPTIFLAHSSQDKFFVRRLAEELRKNGVNIWIDEAEIKVGDSLTEKIGKAIKETDYFGVVLSHNSINSEWVQKELQIANQKEIREGKIVVLPILMESVEIPPFLSDKLYADFTTPDKFESSVKKLVDSLSIEVLEDKRKEEKQIEMVWVSEAEDLLMGFDDIRIVGIDEKRTHNPDPTKLLFNVYLNLSSEPSSDWVEIFNAERRFPRHTMWRRAWIESKNIIVHCALDELEKYHLEDLQQDVDTTNKKYRQYLGEKAQQKAKTGLEEREVRDTLKELKRRLKFE